MKLRTTVTKSLTATLSKMLLSAQPKRVSARRACREGEGVWERERHTHSVCAAGGRGGRARRGRRAPVELEQDLQEVPVVIRDDPALPHRGAARSRGGPSRAGRRRETAVTQRSTGAALCRALFPRCRTGGRGSRRRAHDGHRAGGAARLAAAIMRFAGSRMGVGQQVAVRAYLGLLLT